MKRGVFRALKFVTVALVLFLPISAAHARTLKVATTGKDSATCGLVLPCRTITRAIANAVAQDTIIVGPGTYGDLNQNGMLGEAGEEPGSSSCYCLLWVNKPVVLISSDGAAATIIDARSVDVGRNVVITAGGEFGRAGKGFTVTPTNLSVDNFGIVIDADDLVVRGNQIVSTKYTVGASSSSEVGLLAQGAGSVLIDGNQVMGWLGTGISVTGSGKTVQKNQVSLNSVGINAQGVNTVSYNVVTANAAGVRLHGATRATRNATYGNTAGIEAMAGFAGTIEQNNVFSNRHCGLSNHTPVLIAPHNYWGAATGPGIDPADVICNFASGGVTLPAPVATRPFVIRALISP
jgi:hypothetical protein